MYRFKKSLIALTGVLTLVAIVTVALPHIGRGASGTSAPTTQTQNVNVVNTPTVSAQQNGTWSVGINGTPTVTVSNFPATTNIGIDSQANTVKVDTTNPLPVRDVDNPARQPFQMNTGATIADGEQSAVLTFDVPAQKRVVIEYVSLQGYLPTGQKFISLDFNTSPFLNSSQILHHYFGTTFQATINGHDYFVTSQSTRLYSEGKVDSMRAVVIRNDTVGGGQVEVGLSGYLVDVP